MRPCAREHQGAPANATGQQKLEEAKNGFSEGAQPCHTVNVDFWPQNKEKIHFCPLKHPLYGALLQPPRDPDLHPHCAMQPGGALRGRLGAAGGGLLLGLGSPCGAESQPRTHHTEGTTSPRPGGRVLRGADARACAQDNPHPQSWLLLPVPMRIPPPVAGWPVAQPQMDSGAKPGWFSPFPPPPTDSSTLIVSEETLRVLSSTASRSRWCLLSCSLCQNRFRSFHKN